MSFRTRLRRLEKIAPPRECPHGFEVRYLTDRDEGGSDPYMKGKIVDEGGADKPGAVCLQCGFEKNVILVVYEEKKPADSPL